MDHEYLLEIDVLGSPHLRWHHQPIDIPRRQVRALLYRIAVSTRPVSYDHLCYLFWPDQMQTVARRRLTHVLSHLHTALPDSSLLITTNDAIMLNPKFVRSDAVIFQDALKPSPGARATHELLNAYSLYRGKFLDGFSAGNSQTLEVWIQQQQAHYERIFLLLLETLITHAIDMHEYDTAIVYCHAYLDINNLAEDMHRRLIELYIQKGDDASAQKQFETYATLLYVELGEKLLPETIEALEKRFKKPRYEDKKLNLYASIPFIQRETEIYRLSSMYKHAQTGKGVLCFIHGESGVGKSRLIQEFLSQVTGNVLHTQCYAGTQKMPYYPLLSLFTEQDRLHTPSHELLTHASSKTYQHNIDSALAQVSDAESIRMRMYPALENLCLEQIKNDQPLVFCLEDAQWADLATLNWLAYFGHKTQNQCVLILVSYCCAGNHDLHELHHKLHQTNVSFETIHLQELKRQAVSELLSYVIDEDNLPDAEQIQELYRLTGGNPFYLLEIGYNFVMNRRSYPHFYREFLPTSLEQALDTRLEDLRPMARQVLEAIAARNAPCSLDDLLYLTRQTETDIGGAIEQLLDAALITKKKRGYQLRHTLMRKRIQQRMKSIHKEVLERRIKRLSYPEYPRFTFSDLRMEEN